ncbi:biofilm PGA synthesis protein PgaD [Rosenbergiella nectarea]|uniref:Biofilm PGA synthesis protein PgaD n=1 Tax=Rosenbergiella nectarea TaxID=988801 RepID=A0A1H9LG20_9GAMM|nr:biofilm PGA synthesis protein PgaD [Rosenbergiella nectarea]
MNSQPILITEPRLSIRIVDSLLTIIAWGGFLYLILHEYQLLFSEQYRSGVSPATTLLNYFFICTHICFSLYLVGEIQLIVF